MDIYKMLNLSGILTSLRVQSALERKRRHITEAQASKMAVRKASHAFIPRKINMPAKIPYAKISRSLPPAGKGKE